MMFDITIPSVCCSFFIGCFSFPCLPGKLLCILQSPGPNKKTIFPVFKQFFLFSNNKAFSDNPLASSPTSTCHPALELCLLSTQYITSTCHSSAYVLNSVVLKHFPATILLYARKARTTSSPFAFVCYIYQRGLY